MLEHDNVRKRMYICMRDCVTLLYSIKLTEHYKPAMMENIKIILKNILKTKPKQNKKKTPQSLQETFGLSPLMFIS